MPKRIIIFDEERFDAITDTLQSDVKSSLKVVLNQVSDLNMQFTGGYNFVFCDNQEGGKIRHVTRLDNGKFDEKNWIKNIFYRPVAHQLVEKFEEIKHIRPEQILFLEDTFWKKPAMVPAKKCWKSQIKLTDSRFYAMTGYIYIITFRTWFIEKMGREQVVAQLFHELKHIGPDGNIEKHDLEDWSNMIATLGADYSTTRATITDLLSDSFFEFEDLHRKDKQTTMFDNEVHKQREKKAKEASNI